MALTKPRKTKRPKIKQTKRGRFGIYARDGFRCVYCQRKVIAFAHNSNPLAATLDHVKCFSKGGSDAAKNLVTCCSECNSRRGATYISTWTNKIAADKAELAATRRRLRNTRRRKVNLLALAAHVA